MSSSKILNTTGVVSSVSGSGEDKEVLLNKKEIKKGRGEVEIVSKQ